MKNRLREINKTSQKRETQAAKDIGGERCPASGSGVMKGDARNEKWMVEDKFTRSSTFLLRLPVVQKARAQALKTGRKPVIRVGLPKCELAIISWDDFCDLISEGDEE